MVLRGVRNLKWDQKVIDLRVLWINAIENDIKVKEHYDKHAYIILTPFNQPHFYILKLRFTGVYIIFLISAQKT